MLNKNESSDLDVVLELFPESKSRGFYSGILIGVIALLLVISCLLIAKAEGNRIGVMGEDKVFCETPEQMSLYLLKGSKVKYVNDPLPELGEGCVKLSILTPTLWSKHSVYTDRVSKAEVIEVATPLGIRYSYTNYERIEDDSL